MRAFVPMLVLLLAACAGTGLAPEPYQPRPGQGQYLRPAWLDPVPTPRVPDADICNSRMYRGLVGQHEGAIHIAGLPGAKRVVKPAFAEGFESEFPALPTDANPFREVMDYLPDQVLYVPSIRTVEDLSLLGEVRRDRLTLELDRDGYVQEVDCR